MEDEKSEYGMYSEKAEKQRRLETATIACAMGILSNPSLFNLNPDAVATRALNTGQAIIKLIDKNH